MRPVAGAGLLHERRTKSGIFTKVRVATKLAVQQLEKARKWAELIKKIKSWLISRFRATLRSVVFCSPIGK